MALETGGMKAGLAWGEKERTKKLKGVHPVKRNSGFIKFFTSLIILLFFLFLPGPVIEGGNQVRYVKNFSHGLVVEDSIYFVLEYRVSEDRSPLWFIMPIERSPKFHYQKLFLYSWTPCSEELKQLAVLREEFPFPPRINVGLSRFNSTPNGFVFIVTAGSDEDHRQVYELRAWDIESEGFSPINGQKTNIINLESPLYLEYFADYLSPWVDNPGIISIAELKEELEELDQEDWDLPREW